MNIYCQVCGESVCSLHRVDTPKGIRWLCKGCMAKLRKIEREEEKKK